MQLNTKVDGLSARARASIHTLHSYPQPRRHAMQLNTYHTLHSHPQPPLTRCSFTQRWTGSARERVRPFYSRPSFTFSPNAMQLHTKTDSLESYAEWEQYCRSYSTHTHTPPSTTPTRCSCTAKWESSRAIPSGSRTYTLPFRILPTQLMHSSIHPLSPSPLPGTTPPRCSCTRLGVPQLAPSIPFSPTFPPHPRY